MSKQPPPNGERPDLASVPLFTAFGDATTDVGRPGRVRSAFTLPPTGGATPTASVLHVVGRRPQSDPDAQDTAPVVEVDWDQASELRAVASIRYGAWRIRRRGWPRCSTYVVGPPQNCSRNMRNRSRAPCRSSRSG